MLSKQERDIVNINPWSYTSDDRDAKHRAPREQPNMSGDIDTDYYDERINPRNSVVIDIIHYYVQTQGVYPKIGKEFLSRGPFSTQSWRRNNEGSPPEWFNRITETDLHAYAALYPHNVYIEKNDALFSGDPQYNPESLGLVRTSDREARESIFPIFVEQSQASTNTTRLAQFPEGQKNLGKGEEWLTFQRKKRADIVCRIEALVGNQEEAIAELNFRKSEIDTEIETYLANQVSDSAKRLSAVTGRMTPQYIRFLLSLIPEDERPTANEIYEIENDEVVYNVSTRVNLELNLYEWWTNLDPGKMKKGVYFNPINLSETFGKGRYFYIHNTGIIDPTAFDRGSDRVGQYSTSRQLEKARKKGIQEILRSLNKDTSSNREALANSDEVIIETKKDVRPGTPWKYAVIVPLSVIEELPLAQGSGEANLVSSYRAALRQKQFRDAARHRVSYRVANLENKSLVTSNSLRVYDAKIIIEGAFIKGISLREQSVKIRSLPSLVDRLLLLNNLKADEVDFDAIEFIFDINYNMLGFYYNGYFHTKGVGVGDYVLLTDEDVLEVLGNEPEVEPCDTPNTTSSVSQGTYNVFSSYSATTNGLLLYGNEIFKLATIGRNALPWTEFVNSYIIPEPEIIPSSMSNMTLDNLEDFLKEMDSNIQKTPEDRIKMNDLLILGPPNLGASASSVIANARALALDSMQDGTVNCENIENITKEIISFIMGTAMNPSLGFWQIPREKLLAIAFKLAYNEIFKAVTEYVSSMADEQVRLIQNQEGIHGGCVEEAVGNLSPAAGAMLSQALRTAQGGNIQSDVLMRLATQIVEDQFECLLGGIGNNILINVQNKVSGPWEQAALEGYKIANSTRPKLTLQGIKKTGWSGFFATWGKKLVQMMVAAIVQEFISQLTSEIRRMIACDEKINIDKFESNYPGLGLMPEFAETYGEADLNNILENSGINNFDKIIKKHINGVESPPTHEQAFEFHDDISKMTTARELNGLLNGTYPSGDRLVLDIHGMVYGKTYTGMIGASLERGDTIYASPNKLIITPENIVSYLIDLGTKIPKSEKDKTFQPHRNVEDSECIPAGQNSYDILRDVGYSPTEIASQVNENLCSALERLNNFCEKNDPNKLESVFGNFLRSLTSETTPPIIKFFLGEISDIQDEARKALSRLIVDQIDYRPPGLLDLTTPGQNGYEARDFKEIGLDYNIETDTFVLDELRLTVDFKGSVLILDEGGSKTLVSLEKSKNNKFRQIQEAQSEENPIPYDYSVPQDLYPGLSSNRQRYMRSGNHDDMPQTATPIGKILRLRIFENFPRGMNPGNGVLLRLEEHVSNSKNLGEVLSDFYITEAGSEGTRIKRLVWESLFGKLLEPDNLDPCLDGNAIARAEACLEVIRIRIISYLLNIVPWANLYGQGSPMSKIIISEYLYNQITTKLEEQGTIRKVLETTPDIAKAFTVFADLNDAETDRDRLRIVISRLYEETLRKLRANVPAVSSFLDFQRTRLSQDAPDVNEILRNYYDDPMYTTSLLGFVMEAQGATRDLEDQEGGQPWIGIPQGMDAETFKRKMTILLNHVLPVDAIIALQMIYLDRYYNHIDRVPEFSFIKEKTIKEIDDAFRDALDPTFIPKFVPKFGVFPLIVGNVSYFRREDIADAIFFRISYIKNSIQNLRSLIEDNIVRPDSEVYFEEREMAYYRVKKIEGQQTENNYYTSEIYEGTSRDVDAPSDAAVAQYEPILPRSLMSGRYYIDDVVRPANFSAYLYTPHRGYFEGNNDWPMWRTFANAITSYPAINQSWAQPLETFEGQQHFLAGDAVRDSLIENLYYPEDHRRRDSFGFMLLEFLRRYRQPGQEFQRRVSAWSTHWESGPAQDDTAYGRLRYFITETTDQQIGFDAIRHVGYYQDILQRIAEIADPQAVAVLDKVRNAKSSLDSLEATLNLNLRTLQQAEVITAQEQQSDLAAKIKNNNIATKLINDTATLQTTARENIARSQKYPTNLFTIETGRRDENYFKQSTDSKIRMVEADLQGFTVQAQEFFGEIELLLQAYIETEV